MNSNYEIYIIGLAVLFFLIIIFLYIRKISNSGELKVKIETLSDSLEPEDMAALTMEASALAKVPLSGTNHTVGVDDFHKI